MKLAVIVGHSALEPGASSQPPLSLHEYDYNRGIADKVKDAALLLGIECQVFLRDGIGISGVGQAVNNWINRDPGCSIELHFNWSAENVAQGTETLVDYKIPASGDLARLVQDAVCKVFGRSKKNDRGINWLRPRDRGDFNLWVLDHPSCLIEPGFGSSYYDSGLMKDKADEYANCLANAAHEFLFKD